MNTHWKTFLLTQQALVENENDILFPSTGNIEQNSIYPLTHFAVLTVAGNDAALLLQGQITCNVNDINEHKSSLAAMCNPKGRVIATFLLVKKADVFLLVLPVELLEIVKNRLQMYVLRSDVKIIDSSDSYCLFGLCEAKPTAKSFLETEVQQDSIAVNFSGATSRKLILADVDTAISIWSGCVGSKGFRQASAGEWRFLDIIAGIPWLTTLTSEEFIPQMLNLDKLGGISFNKGCYTGQEIVARTHYLGKAKREMFLAECDALVVPEPNSSIVYLEDERQEAIGKVLLAQKGQHNCKMLVVLQALDPNLGVMALKDYEYAQLNLLPFNA